MKHWKWIVGGIAVLAVAALVVAMAIGQPAPPGGAPAAAPGAGPGGGGGRGGGMGQQRTPEEAAKARLDGLVQMLGQQAGITDQDKQALTTCMVAQENIRRGLRQKLTAMVEAIRANAADADIAKQLAAYMTAMQATQPQKAAAEQTLTTALNLAQRPKLHAALLMLGVLDNGMPGGGMMGMGRRGGGQGGPGGPGGGPGGPGGGGGQGGANPMPAQPPQPQGP